MHKKTSLYAISAVAALALAAPIYAVVDEAQDKAKAEKELKELEAQRAKLDTRIRDLNKQLGRPSVEIREFHNLKDLSPEDRAKMEAHIKEAMKHVETSLKNMPDVSKIVEKALKGLPEHSVVIEKSLKNLPDVGAIVEKSLKGLHDGKDFQFNFESGKGFDREKFRAHMEKMREELHKNLGDKFKNFKPGEFDFKFDVSPEGRLRRGGDANPEMRKALDDLRKELQKLRDEIKKGKGNDVNLGSEPAAV